MNIFVVTSDGRYSARPDTTLERECKDFYLPDDCESLLAYKCTYIKVKKAGKAVAERFAERYVEGCGAGLLLYGVLRGQGSGEEFRLTPYIDGTTVLNPHLHQPDDRQMALFARAISAVTQHTSIRIGDYICIEEKEYITCRCGDVLEFSQSEKFSLL